VPVHHIICGIMQVHYIICGGIRVPHIINFFKQGVK
jgi:hypothetical protein